MERMDGQGDVSEGTPRVYLANWVDRPVALSGFMDDPLWDRAAWSEDFVDILGDAGPPPRYRTRLKMLWDDQFLTIGAELEEPHVWATHTKHDSVIFEDNDFEVFIDPDGDGTLYGEFEINALNTTWDLLLTRPYITHGAAISSWEMTGIRTAVGVNGTINDPSDEDRGWKVEIAIPWTSLAELARRELPPDEGDVWRINFSRVEWEHEVIDGRYRKIAGIPEMNWVWSPQGVVDMHRPLRWGALEFTRTGESRFAGFAPEIGRLEGAFETQRMFKRQNGRWASHSELGPEHADVTVEKTTSLLEMRLGDWHIDHHARIWRD